MNKEAQIQLGRRLLRYLEHPQESATGRITRPYLPSRRRSRVRRLFARPVPASAPPKPRRRRPWSPSWTPAHDRRADVRPCDVRPCDVRPCDVRPSDDQMRVRCPGWNFGQSINKGVENNKLELGLLTDLAAVITSESEISSLNKFPEWKATSKKKRNKTRPKPIKKP